MLGARIAPRNCTGQGCDEPPASTPGAAVSVPSLDEKLSINIISTAGNFIETELYVEPTMRVERQLTPDRSQ